MSDELVVGRVAFGPSLPGLSWKHPAPGAAVPPVPSGTYRIVSTADLVSEACVHMPAAVERLARALCSAEGISPDAASMGKDGKIRRAWENRVWEAERGLLPDASSPLDQLAEQAQALNMGYGPSAEIVTDPLRWPPDAPNGSGASTVAKTDLSASSGFRSASENRGRAWPRS